MKYDWLIPLWIGIAFQIIWNLVASFCLGDNSAIGNWMFSRNGPDGGILFLKIFWILVGFSSVVIVILKFKETK